VSGRQRERRAIQDVQHERIDRGLPPGTCRLSVVVPAFNEGEQAAIAVRDLRAALTKVAESGGLEIVVVDDGSPDNTSGAAGKAGADQVIVLPQNRGKGAAVRAGVLAANGRTIAYTDADLTYPPEQLLRLLELVEDGWDVVVGSRRHEDTTTLVRARRLREVTGRVFNLLTSMVLLGEYRDTQCGLKAFRSDVARVLFEKQRVDGFAFDVELFHLAERYRLSLVEVPVTLSNSVRSSVRVVSAATRMLRDLGRVLRWARTGVYDLSPEQWKVVDRRRPDR
jgi:dolichyl-phosphate beta-glucosyltransferase